MIVSDLVDALQALRDQHADIYTSDAIGVLEEIAEVLVDDEGRVVIK